MALLAMQMEMTMFSEAVYIQHPGASEEISLTDFKQRPQQYNRKRISVCVCVCVCPPHQRYYSSVVWWSWLSVGLAVRR